MKPREVDGPTQGHTGGKLQNSSPGWAPRSQAPARRSAERALRLSPNPPPAAMTALTFTTEDRLASSHIRSQATQPPGSLLPVLGLRPLPCKTSIPPISCPRFGELLACWEQPSPRGARPAAKQAGAGVGRHTADPRSLLPLPAPASPHIPSGPTERAAAPSCSLSAQRTAWAPKRQKSWPGSPSSPGWRPQEFGAKRNHKPLG